MTTSPPGEVTRLLGAIEDGDPAASEELLPLVYQELRALARSRMADEPQQTLQPTALVHEAYLRLVGSRESSWDSRGHFFAAAAEAMRRLLVERARRQAARKRGGDYRFVELADQAGMVEPPTEELLALDAALSRLEEAEEDLARLVKLRFFAGLTVAETAAALGASERTTARLWRRARAWLEREMSSSASGDDSPSPAAEDR